VPRVAAWRLLDYALAPSTLSSYARGCDRFSEWLRANGVQHVNSLRALDTHLTNYVQFLYDNGFPQHHARDAIAGVTTAIRPSPNTLRFANAAMRGWRRAEPSTKTRPMPWPVAVLLAMQLTRTGHGRMGVAVLLAFRAMLRIGEVLALCASDITSAPPFDGNHHPPLPRPDPIIGDGTHGPRPMYIRLRHTKTGPNQTARVYDTGVHGLMAPLLRDTAPTARLFEWSGTVVHAHIARALDSIGIGKLFTWHSLRHGSASLMFEHTRSIERVRLEGRWASVPSARHYVQDGAVAEVMARAIPPRLAAAGVRLASDVETALFLARPLSQSH
jgi:hypothetical protein